MAKIRLFGRDVRLPASRVARLALGGAFVAGGSLGFLPVLGFWMVPVGLMVLSVDSPKVRRFRRRSEVRGFRKWRALRASPPGGAFAASVRSRVWRRPVPKA
jgi:hypothetical protein